MRAVVAFLKFLRPSHHLFAACLPACAAAAICWMLKSYQVEMFGQNLAYKERLVNPELAIFPLIAGLSLLLFHALPSRLHRIYQALICLVLFALILLLALDTASISIRFAPIHYLEFKTFLDSPAQIWPVVSSELTIASIAQTTSAFSGLALLLGVLWWFTSKPRIHAPRPLHVTGSYVLIYAGILFAGGLHLAERNSVPERHLKLQMPIVERLGRSLLLEMSSVATVTPKPILPLVVDRSSGKKPFNIILFIYESTARNVTSIDPANRTQPETTPFLRQLADEGFEAPDAYTAASHSSKSLVGMLCGQHPYPLLRDRIEISVFLNTCLPQALAEGGYRTGFFQAPDLEYEHREFMTRLMGFQTVDGGLRIDQTGFERVNYLGYEDRIVLKPAVNWVKQSADPYFLTIMTGTTHHPYGSPGHPIEDGSHPPPEVGKGLQEIARRYVDAFFRDLVSSIDAEHGLENTVIIALGDHGDAFGENGLNHHSFVPYDNVTHIPLVVWGPDVLTPERLGRPAVPGSQLTGLRHSTDIMPTLLSLLGWGWPEGSLPGRPLFELEGHPSVISSCLSPNHCMSMRDEKYKYVQHEWFLDGLPEVYDLSKDPGERVNLASTLPEPFLREKQLQMWSAKEQLIAQYEFTARTKPHVELPEQDQMTYARVLLQQRGHIPLKSGPMEDE